MNPIASFGQLLIHFRHFTQVSLSIFSSQASIEQEGQLLSQIPQHIHFSLSIFNLNKENLEIKPTKVPQGQMCVQNNLSLNAARMPTTTSKIPDDIDIINGKFVMDKSLYVKIRPAINSINTAKIIYLPIQFGRFSFILSKKREIIS